MNRPVDLLQDNREFDQDIFNALNKKGYSESEADLIRALGESKSVPEAQQAVVALGYKGGDKSLEILTPLLSQSSEDMRSTAVLAIAKIAGKDSTNLLADLLTQDFEPKVYPMAALWKVGDASAINEVRIFADSMIAGRAKYVDWSNDPLYVIEYLKKYSNNKEDVARYTKLQDLYNQKNKSIASVFKGVLSRIKK